MVLKTSNGFKYFLNFLKNDSTFPMTSAQVMYFQQNTFLNWLKAWGVTSALIPKICNSLGRLRLKPFFLKKCGH